jgi:uncharacterized protein (DUF1697 family)
MSERWVAFLRAINVGGRRVTGDQLVAAFAGLGLSDVSSFMASGNVLFTAGNPDPNVIEVALEARLGYEVPTMLRSRDDIVRLSASQPFTPAELSATEGRAQVILLREPLSDEGAFSGLSDTAEGDLLRAGGSEVFWLPKHGVSDSALDMKALEANTGPFTVRTFNTIVRIASRM